MFLGNGQFSQLSIKKWPKWGSCPWNFFEEFLEFGSLPYKLPKKFNFGESWGVQVP